MEIRKMSVMEAEADFQTLTDYYYQNSISCSCLTHFSKDEAMVKIRGMISHMNDGSAIVYGCFDGSQLLGYLWAYEMQFREERRIYISEVHIDQRLRGQGFGSQLIKSVETEARNRGIKALYIHTEANNSGAIRLYERLGFQTERIQLRKELYE